MQYKDHRDPEYWVLRIRTHEWAEHQLVSLLDIDGVGRGTIRALWKLGITTAALLREADPVELAERLRAYHMPPCPADRAPEVIRGWQRQIERLWKEKESAQV